MVTRQGPASGRAGHRGRGLLLPGPVGDPALGKRWPPEGLAAPGRPVVEPSWASCTICRMQMTAMSAHGDRAHGCASTRHGGRLGRTGGTRAVTRGAGEASWHMASQLPSPLPGDAGPPGLAVPGPTLSDLGS